MARSRDDYTDEPPRRRRRDDDDEDDRPRRRQRRDDEDEDEDDRPRRRQRRDDDEEDDRPRRRTRRDDLPRLSRADLRTVAWAQKVIIFCILGNLSTIPLRMALNTMPDEAQLLVMIGLLAFYLIIAVTATVFVFMMAVKVYSPGVGVLLGFLTLIPCIGLIVLLIINSKATKILQANDVRVGLLGANMSDLP